MEDIKEIIAKNISELRAKSSMTQLELAEKLHYSDKAVSKWERGESVPEITTLVLLAKLFGVTLDYLVTENHEECENGTDAFGDGALTGEEEEKKETEEEKQRRLAERRRKINRATVIAVSCASVWFIAVLSFVLIDIFAHGQDFAWVVFIYAIPVSATVWLVLNSVWFNKHTNYLIISIMAWGVILSIYFTLFIFSLNIWQLFLLGAPGQIVIILASLLRPSAQKPLTVAETREQIATLVAKQNIKKS